MKKLSVLSLILMFVCIGCHYDSFWSDVVYVTNETSHNVKYIKNSYSSDYNINIELPYGQKTQIDESNQPGEGIPPIFGSFIFDDTLTLKYSVNDTFAKNIYRNYEIEKRVDTKYNHVYYYYYTLTEEDYQNALQQNQR